MPSKQIILAGGLALACCAVAAGRVAAAPQELTPEESAYRQVIHGRAEKIVDLLELTDADQAERVTLLIANYYRGLRDKHDARDARLEEAASADDAVRDAIRSAAQLEVLTQHRQFVAALTAELSAEQVNRVKDGLTYGVAPVTMSAYRALLPNLKPEDERFILANLIEAREHAMDGGSSHEKHGWFGKYKGRINNYLSARGHDLKQAERELARRRAAADQQSTEPQEKAAAE